MQLEMLPALKSSTDFSDGYTRLLESCSWHGHYKCHLFNAMYMSKYQILGKNVQNITPWDMRKLHFLLWTWDINRDFQGSEVPEFC